MKKNYFCIITPTYKRANLLRRAVDSVLQQNYSDFEIIVVNDSPDFDYSQFENYINGKEQVKYFKNKENMGANFCRNLALENASKDSNYIVFLDDDDYLNKNTLNKLNNALQKESFAWLLTNRVMTKSNSVQKLTKIKGSKYKYSYFYDYMLLKNISGDATHTIRKDIATRIKFPQKIKNGEEWLYFIQIKSYITYKDIDSTVTDGYLVDGLTEILSGKYKENTRKLWQEIFKNPKLLVNYKILIYMILRTFRNLIKN